jgi:hypothetical protein
LIPGDFTCLFFRPPENGVGAALPWLSGDTCFAAQASHSAWLTVSVPTLPPKWRFGPGMIFVRHTVCLSVVKEP